MAVTAADLEAKIKDSELEPTHVEVKDTSNDCGGRFEAIIVAPSFEGVGLLERQQKVNEIIKAEVESIHAFSMKTWTPAQHEKKIAAASS